MWSRHEAFGWLRISIIQNKFIFESDIWFPTKDIYFNNAGFSQLIPSVSLLLGALEWVWNVPKCIGTTVGTWKCLGRFCSRFDLFWVGISWFRWLFQSSGMSSMYIVSLSVQWFFPMFHSFLVISITWLPYINHYCGFIIAPIQEQKSRHDFSPYIKSTCT